MTTHDLNDAVRATQRMTDAKLANTQLTETFDELRLEIIDESRPYVTTTNERRGRRWPILAAAAVVVVTVAAVAAFGPVGTDSDDDPIGANSDEETPSTASAAEPLPSAEDSPTILIDDDSWRVADVYEHEDGDGEMEFKRGDELAHLHWRSGQPFSEWLRDRLYNNIDLGEVPVLDTTARVVRYDGVIEQLGPGFTALWTFGDYTLEFRSHQPNNEAFIQLLGQLEFVDMDTWLAAMPSSVILPSQQAAAVEEILKGVIVPDDFDTATIRLPDDVISHSALSSAVTSAAVCAWTDDWLTATEAGDLPAARRAATGLATSHNWPALLEAEARGGWSQIVWDHADSMNTGPGGSGGSGPGATRGFAETALGCDFG